MAYDTTQRHWEEVTGSFGHELWEASGVSLWVLVPSALLALPEVVCAVVLWLGRQCRDQRRADSSTLSVTQRGAVRLGFR